MVFGHTGVGKCDRKLEGEIMKARTQDEHERINAREYPGTRQLCCQCDEPTERCEEDAIYTNDGIGPLCEYCYHQTEEYKEFNQN